MKNLIKYLLPFSAFFVLGQTPMAQPLRETKSSVQMESGCVYIMSPLARQPKIKPIPREVMERCESKLDLIDLGKRTEYAFHDGSTLSGLKSSRNHPWLTLIKDNRGTNLYQEYVGGDKNGIPEMVYYNWADCTDCVSEKEVASMPSKEKDSTILEFQHWVHFIADSTGDSYNNLLPPLENVQGSIRQLYYDTYHGTVGPTPCAFQIRFDSSGNQVNIPLRGKDLQDMLPVEEIKGESYIHLYVRSDSHPDSVAKTLDEFDKLGYDKRGFWGNSWEMTIPLRILPEISKISTIKDIREADMSPMEPASN